MEPGIVDWEAAYESAGLWPIAVELPPGDVVYLLWYQTRNHPSRVLISGGRVVMLTDLTAVSALVADSEGFGEKDPGWDAVRRLARIAGSQSIDEASVTRRLVGQSLEWVQRIPRNPTADQTEELLNCLDLLGEWHHTLAELGLVGRRAPALEGAASILAESVLWGSITPAQAFERVWFLGLWPILERLVSDLMDHTLLVHCVAQPKAS